VTAFVLASLLLGTLARGQEPTPASPPDEPWLRGGLSYAMVPHSYKFTSTAPDTPDSVEYSNGALTGGLAVLVAGHLPHDPTWGAELHWKGFTDLIDLGDEQTYNRFGTDFYLGARYRTDPRNGVSCVGSLGIHRYLSAFFRYPSAAMVAGDPELLNVPVTGLRLGVAGQYVNDKVLAEMGIAQTLAPQPVGFNFSAAGEYRLGQALRARGSLEVDARSIHFDLTGGEATVHDAGVSILLGLTYWLTELP
jgi:hypothetical protein